MVKKLMSKNIVTRFAPSPTGLLHVGGARTALFAWLYAKSHEGKCLLRIEDTDTKRSKDEYTQAIISSFKWLGIDFDGEPVYQSKNKDMHLDAVQSLLEENKAYYCDCSSERLDEIRSAQQKAGEKPKYDGRCRDLNQELKDGMVVRFRNPKEGFVEFVDLVKGPIQISNEELDDLILIRANGTPTYNLSVVVDDDNMGITHVIRGDDHINNTPRQINIFRALGLEIPTYGHVPMILGEDSKRLSKRHGAVGVEEYKVLGVLPEAMRNYLAKLGWSHGDDEIFSMQDLILKFKEGKLNSSPAAFSMDKLKWFNKEYLTQLNDTEIISMLIEEGILLNDDHSKKVFNLVKDRCSLLTDFKNEASYFFNEVDVYDETAVKKVVTTESLKILTNLRVKFLALETWTASNVQNLIQEVVDEFDVGFGKVGLPLRLALTGSTNSPSIDLTAELLGKEKVAARIEKAVNYFSLNQGTDQ